MPNLATPNTILATAQPSAAPATVQRVSATAKSKNDMTARINRVIAAMGIFAGHVYETDGGVYQHVSADGVLLITTPFSKTGYQNYLITRSEGRALNKIYRHMQTVDKRLPWLIYDPLLTRWCVDIATYPAQQDAIKWLKWCNLQKQFPAQWYALTDSRYTAN